VIKIPRKALKKEHKARPEQCFVTIDGATFSTIKELTKALYTMNDDVFYYHVTDWKNDLRAGSRTFLMKRNWLKR